MGCKAPREGHCEACAMQDKSDTLGLSLGLCLSRSQRKQIPARRALPCILPVWAGVLQPGFFASRLVATCFAQRQSMTAGLSKLWKYPLQRLF